MIEAAHIIDSGGTYKRAAEYDWGGAYRRFERMILKKRRSMIEAAHTVDSGI